MAKYIIKRVLLGVLSVFVVATLTFFLMNLVPGGPFVAEKSISKQAQEALAAKYGLDKPLMEQYWTLSLIYFHFTFVSIFVPNCCAYYCSNSC